MTPAQFAAKMARVERALTAEIVRAERVTRREALKAADAQSAGPYSQAELTAAGHPYARRAPNASYDPAIVNRGKGIFRRSWRSLGPIRWGGVVITKIWNEDPNSRFLQGGTRLMVARPVSQAILKAVTPGRFIRLAAAVARALKS
jgi:hypothetical protein